MAVLAKIGESVLPHGSPTVPKAGRGGVPSQPHTQAVSPLPVHKQRASCSSRLVSTQRVSCPACGGVVLLVCERPTPWDYPHVLDLSWDMGTVGAPGLARAWIARDECDLCSFDV